MLNIHEGCFSQNKAGLLEEPEAQLISVSTEVWRYHSLLATLVLAFVACIFSGTSANAAETDPFAWPEPNTTTRPWTRWWWLGSAVDKPNLERLLKLYGQAGFGGVEICPIYGAKGFENRYIDFLSPEWTDRFIYTETIAKKLGLGVDLTTGTGWPFGGPQVTLETASKKIVLKKIDLIAGSPLPAIESPDSIISAVAVESAGTQVDLNSQIRAQKVEWAVPRGKWRLYTLTEQSAIQEVKRAAPGGHGHVLDPFSTKAVDEYLSRFDRAFSGTSPSPRAEFHDSYEYYGANWTDELLTTFEQNRGYDLRTELAAFFGDGPTDRVARVKCDYRQTVSELHEAYVARWSAWSHAHGSLSREQAHGAPANIEDVYALADIPETEVFGDPSEDLIPMTKFASSAAHLNGRPLASSESFTWRGEHFQVSLADLKSETDYLFLAGINHIFYHGVPYSPGDVPWPGWLFYAAVNFGPEGGVWHDLPAFNAYVTRCQSVLQAGEPDNDILLYFPVYDLWQSAEGMLIPFGMPGKWMQPTSFHAASLTLWKKGYSFDEATDRLLEKANVQGNRISLAKSQYRAILVPAARIMPVATLRHLIKLAHEGATILFEKSLPVDVPGLGRLDERQNEFQILLRSLATVAKVDAGISRIAVGSGQILVGDNLSALLQAANVPREAMADAGLRCIRRRTTEDRSYFIVNPGRAPVEGWFSLGVPTESAILLDPRFDALSGEAALRTSENKSQQVYLQLLPGESRILRAFTWRKPTARQWAYAQVAGSPQVLQGNWRIQFIEGGPVLPRDYNIAELSSWTHTGDPEAKRFAGTASYTLTFDFEPHAGKDWLLDLGRIADSARVRVNGRLVGTFWSFPFQRRIGQFLQKGSNTIEVEVTNVAANRIADLDRRGVIWKNFQEINFVGRDYKPFDASHWPLRDAGLLGPVTLVPLTSFTP